MSVRWKLPTSTPKQLQNSVAWANHLHSKRAQEQVYNLEELLMLWLYFFRDIDHENVYVFWDDLQVSLKIIDSVTIRYRPRFCISLPLYNCVSISMHRDPVEISWRCLILIKLEWLGYRVVKKLYQYVKPFPYATDRRTDRIAILISRVIVLTRDRNVAKKSR